MENKIVNKRYTIQIFQPFFERKAIIINAIQSIKPVKEEVIITFTRSIHIDSAK